MTHDFSGWATKANLKCSDGRTILPDAFKHQDKIRVPLVWRHARDEQNNILGHAILEHREEGVYAYGHFNDSEAGKHAKMLVEHGDIDKLSIYANNLVEKSKSVMHGMIREVSLVLAGANPGAVIDYVSVQHSDGDITTLDDEAIIYTGLALEHSDEDDEDDLEEDLEDENDEPSDEDESEEPEDVEHADGEKTVKDIYESMNDEQKTVVHFMIGAALEDKDATHTDQEDGMTHSIFENNGEVQTQGKTELSHDELSEIVRYAEKNGSLKEAFLEHAVEYGIENIDLLFPDAKALENTPELIGRKVEWVDGVISGTRHAPFSRIKSLSADITHDDARAKGYIKGNYKKEEWFGLTKRETTPTTIYKKQKLDRDDIVDITTLDVVAWLKGEMRLMLNEEIARAVLFGDGREIDDEDKIDESKIRPVAKDSEFYTHKMVVSSNTVGNAFADALAVERPKYRGSGNPVMFIDENELTTMLLERDKLGRRLYNTESDLAAALRVSKLVPVPVIEDVQDEDGNQLVAVMLNLSDYTIGTDRGGDVSMFDDFDIDYNQYKYLIEGRMSGALTKFKTAIAVWRSAGASALEVTPAEVTESSTPPGVVIPTSDGVDYFIDGSVVPAAPGVHAITGEVEVTAEAKSGYVLADGATALWLFDIGA